MPLTREQKTELLNQLKENFSKAKAVSFSNYSGLSVNQMKELRDELRKEGIEYKIAKKTIIKLACDAAGIKELPNESLDGPIAAAFAFEDEIAPFKAIALSSKKFENLKLLGGIMNGAPITPAQAAELSKLPAREELLAKLVGSLMSPISGFYGVLHGSLRKFVATVEAVRVQKVEA